MTNSDKSSAQFKAKFTSDSGIFILIQPTSFQLSQSKVNWLNSAVKAQISTFHSHQYSMVNKSEAN